MIYRNYYLRLNSKYEFYSVIFYTESDID